MNLLAFVNVGPTIGRDGEPGEFLPQNGEVSNAVSTQPFEILMRWARATFVGAEETTNVQAHIGKAIELEGANHEGPSPSLLCCPAIEEHADDLLMVKVALSSQVDPHVVNPTPVCIDRRRHVPSGRAVTEILPNELHLVAEA
jgi:hypothetical protein